MSEHAPTPWIAEGSYILPADKDQPMIAKATLRTKGNYKEAPINAAFIVLACNAYDDLVAEVVLWKARYEDEKRDHETTIKHAERERNEYFGMTFLDEEG